MGVYGNWIRIANQDKYNINYIAERKYGDMKKLMKKLWEKKDSKKGFTLVELIVVLVILAILAAIMVPTLTGWIDRAKQRQIQLEARNVELAAQAALYEAYATGGSFSGNTWHLGEGSTNTGNGYEIDDYIKSVCGDNWTEGVTSCSVTWDGTAVVTEFTYVSDGITATYNLSGDDAGWTIE